MEKNGGELRWMVKNFFEGRFEGRGKTIETHNMKKNRRYIIEINKRNYEFYK